MASKNRKLRTTRLSFDDDEDAGPGAAGGAAPAAAAGAAADAPPPPPPPPPGKEGKKKPAKSLLSFGDDEDMAPAPSGGKAKRDKGGGAPGGAAAPGRDRDKGDKDKSVRAKFRAKLPSPPRDAEPQPAQRSNAGEYTTERLRELQKNTLRLPATTLAASLEEAAASAKAEGGGAGAGVIKLTGSFKQAKAKDDRFTIPSQQLVGRARLPCCAAARAVRRAAAVRDAPWRGAH
jgi:GC-rich sequence DNA-binding factor